MNYERFPPLEVTPAPTTTPGGNTSTPLGESILNALEIDTIVTWILDGCPNN